MNLHPLEVFAFSGVSVAILFLLLSQPFVSTVMVVIAGPLLIYGQYLRHSTLDKK